MGSKVLPILSSYVVDDWLSIFNINIPFPKRNLDHIVTAIAGGNITQILTIISSYNESIQFTIEEETKTIRFPSRIWKSSELTIILW